MSNRLTCALTLALLLALTPGARADEVRAANGAWTEPVTSIREEEGALVLRTAARAVPLAQVKSVVFVEVGPPPAAALNAAAVTVHLAGGDVLRGELRPAQGEGTLHLATRTLGTLAIPFERLRAVVPMLHERADGQPPPAPGDERDEVRVSGTVVRGAVLTFDGARLVIDTTRVDDGGVNFGAAFTLGASKVESVSFFNEAAPAPAGLRLQVRLVDGSIVTGAPRSLDEEALRLEHPLGGAAGLVIPRQRVAELAVQGGAFTYLSDLAPTAVEQRLPEGFAPQPELWAWRRDRAVTGEPLRLGGERHDKGLGVHSYCALTFALDGAPRTFNALVGLDDATRHLGEPGLGGVVFKVLVDGKPAREQPAAGWAKRKGEPPTRVTVDVTGARAITLIVDFDPTTLHILGRADWADAHLVQR